MTTLATLLAMRAADAGLDRRSESVGEWLAFGGAGNRATLWLSGEGETLRAATAPADVAAEVGELPGCESLSAGLPTGASAGWRCENQLVLDTLCRRIAMLGHALPDAPLRRYEAAVAAEVVALPQEERSTERIAQVRERVGQDIFRAALMEYWGGKCPITGITEPALLRASHIKPWADSTDAERLDVHNGLLLAVHLDAAFDAGLISFDDEGRMLVSERLGEVERGVLGVGAVTLTIGHSSFLTRHRSQLFKDTSTKEGL